MGRPTYHKASIPSNVVAATKSDTTNESMSGILYVPAAGDVKFTTEGGQDVTLTFEEKTWFPVLVKRVWSTGTTVTGSIYICY